MPVAASRAGPSTNGPQTNPPAPSAPHARLWSPPHHLFSRYSASAEMGSGCQPVSRASISSSYTQYDAAALPLGPGVDEGPRVVPRVGVGPGPGAGWWNGWRGGLGCRRGLRPAGVGLDRPGPHGGSPGGSGTGTQGHIRTTLTTALLMWPCGPVALWICSGLWPCGPVRCGYLNFLPIPRRLPDAQHRAPVQPPHHARGRRGRDPGGRNHHRPHDAPPSIICFSASLLPCMPVSLPRCATVSLRRCVPVSLPRCVPSSPILSATMMTPGPQPRAA